MIVDAENYNKENEIRLDHGGVNNSFESYCFNMKSTINDEKLTNKIDV